MSRKLVVLDSTSSVDVMPMFGLMLQCATMAARKFDLMVRKHSGIDDTVVLAPRRVLAEPRLSSVVEQPRGSGVQVFRFQLHGGRVARVDIAHGAESVTMVTLYGQDEKLHLSVHPREIGFCETLG